LTIAQRNGAILGEARTEDAHARARRAYEAVGFDRQVPAVEYWQDLSRRPGSGVP
jgi:hypothetical protein